MRLPGSVRALKENHGVRAEFVDDLPAGPAGRASNTVIIGHGDGANLDLRSQLRNRGKNCGAFCAVRHAIGSIFDVAAAENLSIGK